MRWDKTSIVVMNEVRVTSPYLPENVLGGTAAANDRVRKVVRHCTLFTGVSPLYKLIQVTHQIYIPSQLEFERKRLQARAGGQ